MFKVIETYEEAKLYSEAGLLWYKYRRDKTYRPDLSHYWKYYDRYRWDQEKTHLMYAILIEDDEDKQ